MPEYSKRLGHISPQQFQAALRRFDLGEFVCAEPVRVGLFGQNVYVTSTKGQFVLRGVPHYDWQFPTEKFFVDLLHERTRAPVPYPYLLEPSADIMGWSFVLMPRMAGLQLQDKELVAGLAPHDRLEIARVVAGNLAEVQTVRWECAGLYDVGLGGIKPLDLPYREWVARHVREKLDAARSYNDHTTAADARWVESILERARPVLRLPYVPGPVLADYGEHNLLVARGAEGWHVSGLFDLMTAHMGDGQADLSVAVTIYLDENEAVADVFVDEYRRLRPPGEGWATHQQLYMLDLTLSFWRHFQRNEGRMPDRDPSLTYEEWAGPYVRYWEKYE